MNALRKSTFILHRLAFQFHFSIREDMDGNTVAQGVRIVKAVLTELPHIETPGRKSRYNNKRIHDCGVPMRNTRNGPSTAHCFRHLHATHEGSTRICRPYMHVFQEVRFERRIWAKKSGACSRKERRRLCIRVRGGPPSWERGPNDWKLPLSFYTPAPVSFDLFTLIKDNSIWQPPRTVLLFGHSTRDMIAFSPSSVFKNSEEKLILRVSDRHRGPLRGASFFPFFIFFFRFCSLLLYEHRS